jgi:HNH endonuclease
MPARGFGPRRRKGIDSFTKFYGQTCRYCLQRPADSADHFVPWSITRDDRPRNMVPACRRCNSIAGAKKFETYEDKRDYILSRLATKLALVEVYCPKACGVTYARKGVNDTCPDCGEVL